MDLLMHIGCEKTGTTSIQNWLEHNSQALPNRGVVYSRALGRPNNRRLTLYGLEDGRKDELLLQEGIRTPEEHQAFRRRLKVDLQNEVNSAKKRGMKTFVISNEHLSSRLYRDQNVEPVRDLLTPLFDSMKIYCFVRPQIDTCLSLASTMARNGAEVSRKWVSDQLRPGNMYFNAQATVDRWGRFFGADVVEPVPFKQVKDIISYFEAKLGAQENPLPRQKSFNEALDYRVIALCNAMQLKAVENDELNQSRRFFINDLPVLERLSIDRAGAEEMQGRFADSNALLCQQWHQITLGDMTPDWARYPDEGNIDKTMALQEFGPFLRYIVERFNAECWWHQARWAASTAEKEGMAARIDTGIRAAEYGMRAAKQAMRHDLYEQKAERMIENLELRLVRLRRRKEKDDADLVRALEAERLEKLAASVQDDPAN